MTERIVFFNGDWIPASQARISPLDHGFLYGDGVFEGIRAYAGRVFQLPAHMARLYASAKTLMLTIPLSPEEMSAKVLESVRINHLQDAYIRLVVSRGVGDLGLDPRSCFEPTVLIMADQIQLYPESYYQKGLALASVSLRRPSGDVLNPAVKSLNYLNSILAKIEANLRGVPEVVLMNQQGYVVEGTGDNIFIVKEGGLVTPPPSAGILNGITRQVILRLAREAGLDTREENFTLHDLYNADECFMTGTAAEVVPAVSCDGRTIGTGTVGPVTRRLMDLFHDYSRSTGTPVGQDVVA
jgi:branched-chain amino acid aminotransferase